jgi:hypothetical protein
MKQRAKPPLLTSSARNHTGAGESGRARDEQDATLGLILRCIAVYHTFLLARVVRLARAEPSAIALSGQSAAN